MLTVPPKKMIKVTVPDRSPAPEAIVAFENLLDGVDGAADDGEQQLQRLQANKRWWRVRSLLDGVDGAANNSDGIKRAADDSGGEDLLDGVDGTTDDGDGIERHR